MALNYQNFDQTLSDLTQPTQKGYTGTASTLTPIQESPSSQPIQQQPQTQAQPQAQPKAQSSPLVGASQTSGGSTTPPSAPSAPTSISDIYKPQGLSSISQIPEEYQGLFKPVIGQIGRSGVEDYLAKIRGAVDKFGQGAGERRTYESAGIEEMLKRAENAGGDLSQAQGALGATYTGPRTLDTDQVGQIRALSGQLKAYGDILPTLQGTQQLLRETAPSLTRGERRFEAQRIAQDPRYAQIARQLSTELGNLSGQESQARSSAEAYANARAAEEADIASRSRGFVGSELEGLKGELGTRAVEKESGRSNFLKAIQEFQQSGDISKLQGLQGAPTADQISKFTLPPEAAKAKELRTSIDAKYQDIKDVPDVIYRETKRGVIAPRIPDEWWNSPAAKGLSEAQKRDVREKAAARNKEYQAAGLVGSQVYAPHLYASGGVAGHPGQLTQEELPYAYGLKPGELEAFSGLGFGGSDPIYGANLGEFQAPDIRSLVDITGGSGVPYTQENVASGGERDRYNRLAQLLGLQDQLAVGSAAVDPSVQFHPEKFDPAAETARRQAAIQQNALALAGNEYERTRAAHAGHKGRTLAYYTEGQGK